MDTHPYTTTSEKIKYLGTSLMKEVKDLCSENFTFLKKELDIRK